MKTQSGNTIHCQGWKFPPHCGRIKSLHPEGFLDIVSGFREHQDNVAQFFQSSHDTVCTREDQLQKDQTFNGTEPIGIIQDPNQDQDPKS